MRSGPLNRAGSTDRFWSLRVDSELLASSRLQLIAAGQVYRRLSASELRRDRHRSSEALERRSPEPSSYRTHHKPGRPEHSTTGPGHSRSEPEHSSSEPERHKPERPERSTTARRERSNRGACSCGP